MQPFRSVSQDILSSENLPATCELVTFDAPHLNVFAAEVNYCPPHWHPAPELLFVLNGGFSLIVSEQEVNVTAGSFLFIGTDTIHSLEFRVPGSAVLTWQFNPDVFTDSRFQHQRLAHIPTSHYNHSTLFAVATSHLQGLTAPGTSSFHQQAGLFNLLGTLDAIIDTPGQETVNTTNKQQAVIRESIGYINNHYQQPLTIADLADKVHLSYYHYSRLFKKVSGYTPSDYLVMVRVNHAKMLLKNMHKPITDIALECGFAEHKTMIAAFNKHIGHTPTEYRKLYYANFDWRAVDARVSSHENKPVPLAEALKRLEQFPLA